MNSKVIVGLVVVVVILAGGWYALSKNNSSQPVQNMPQSQGQVSPTSAPAQAGKNAVTIQNFSFGPATLTVKVGDSVTWTNQDSAPHSATADNGSFDTGLLSQGKSGSVTFSKAGTYTYHCSVHPMMHGTIVVE